MIKPKWIKKGVACFCNGEGQLVFFIDKVKGDVVSLMDRKGYHHGNESISKLSQVPKELIREKLIQNKNELNFVLTHFKFEERSLKRALKIKFKKEK